MAHIVVLFPKGMGTQQRQRIMDMLRIAAANITVTQFPDIILEGSEQDIVEQIEKLEQKAAKIYEIKHVEIPDIKISEILEKPKSNKQQNYRERYIRNQVNKSYQNQRKIYFNRTKCK
jgi:ribosomal protein S3AE